MDRSILKVFEICIEIELTMAKLYAEYEKLFADDPKIAALWAKTSQEEENHASQFRLLTRLKNEVNANSQIDIRRATQVLEGMRGVLAHIRIRPPKLAEALRSSIEIETKLSDFHVHCAAVFEDNSCCTMFESMMSADKDHVRALEKAYDRLQKPNR